MVNSARVAHMRATKGHPMEYPLEIHCPSGFVFTSRRMFGGAYQAMASIVDRGTQLEAAAHGLSACAGEVLDAGPYNIISTGSKPNTEFWKRAWAVDIMYASIDLRVQSFPRNPKRGKELPITFNCGRCGKLTDNWLISDISIYLQHPRLRKMPLKSREVVRAGSRFETRIDGKRITFDIQRLQQDVDMRDVMKRNAPGRRQMTPVEMVAKQVKSVEGLKAQTLLAIWRWCGEQDAEVLDELLAEFYRTEGTMDTTERVTCQSPDCCIEQDINLPFGGKAFWSPQRAKAEEQIWEEETTENDDSPASQPSETES
jgi:hypothetical protein